MTKLDCSVTGCMHNAENCCCKNTILVEGKTAQDKCDTCCGSFDEKKGGTFRNLFKTPESRLEVECEATNVFIIQTAGAARNTSESPEAMRQFLCRRNVRVSRNGD